ncbi:fimbria/pilus periplasmic chaperone [Proteus mirabilis]|uniref:fimbria/pilus periplasmic chaperone n=1 Tax=Proteus mirabilis TaxID=584 RepID=UPI003F1D181C
MYKVIKHWLRCAFCLMLVYGPLCTPVFASGGITLGGTRVVHPANMAQSTFSVSNKTDSSTYLIQSWVENANGIKTSDFIVTPPLYTSAPGNENVLRIISTASFPQDKERLYYLNIKAIPSVDKKELAKNEGGTLIVASLMQVKLFVRPAGLTPLREKAEDKLQFTRKGDKLSIHNPTPYYLTLTNMKAGTMSLQDVMVPPRENVSIALPVGSGGMVTWNSIGDHGELNSGSGVINQW